MTIDRFFRILMVLCSALAVWPANAQAIRIKEIAAVQGVRSNQLTGYGLVVGLDGTGDQTTQMPYTAQSMNNYLQQLGLSLPPGANMQLKNVAAVLVTAQLPAFAQPGQTIDVTVSSLGDAKSLRGGTLLLTQLRAADGEIYALAQGNVVIAGLSAQGKSGSSITVNTPTSGRIPNGASVEREIASDFDSGPSVHLSLKKPNFETATNVVNAINQRYGRIASTRNATAIEVQAPTDPTARVARPRSAGRN